MVGGSVKSENKPTVWAGHFPWKASPARSSYARSCLVPISCTLVKLICSFFDFPSKWEPNNIRKPCICRCELRAYSCSPPPHGSTLLISSSPSPFFFLPIFSLSSNPPFFSGLSHISPLLFLSLPVLFPFPASPPLPMDLLNFLVQQLDSHVNRCFYH